MARAAAHDVKAEIEELRREIRRHDYLYYVLDAPEITDAEYDALFRRLEALEKAHPELVTPDSPTQRVGGAPLPKFETVRHRHPRLSLANATSRDEVAEFDARVRKLAERAQVEYACEPKMDGVAVELVYEPGRVVPSPPDSRHAARSTFRSRRSVASTVSARRRASPSSPTRATPPRARSSSSTPASPRRGRSTSSATAWARSRGSACARRRSCSPPSPTGACAPCPAPRSPAASRRSSGPLPRSKPSATGCPSRSTGSSSR